MAHIVINDKVAVSNRIIQSIGDSHDNKRFAVVNIDGDILAVGVGDYRCSGTSDQYMEISSFDYDLTGHVVIVDGVLTLIDVELISINGGKTIININSDNNIDKDIQKFATDKNMVIIYDNIATVD